MTDRTSTKVLPNGAIRYGVYDEAGNFLRYEYIKPEDMPTQEGTALNKATLLKDGTATLLGLQPETAVPDDAFNSLCALIIGSGRYGYRLHVSYPDGTSVANKLVAGLAALSGGSLYTDVNGNCLGVSTSSAPTVNIDFSEYFDLKSVSKQLQSSGVITTSTVVAGRSTATSATITTSKSVKFSSAVADYDVALIGGGGGGGCKNAGGGGGGYVTNAFNIKATASSITMVIGAGGIGQQYKTSNGTPVGASGDAGGITSIPELALSANGGEGGFSDAGGGGLGGNGNGRGADGIYTGSAIGGSCNTHPFNVYAIPCSGGGGGYGFGDGQSTGGRDFGGDGARSGEEGVGGNGKGFGGGGGGGGSYGNYPPKGGSGYQGAIMIRWRNK